VPIQEGGTTKIWYDALTGKHIRYGTAIAKALQNNDHEIVLTTRKHPDTLPVAKFLRQQYVAVGQYNPKTSLTRVKSGALRQLKFCELFKNNPPQVAISHGSPDQCRVAFGLGIPIITTVDTPYAEAVHRLTIPYSRYVISSEAIPRRIMQKYNIDGKLLSFEGVDEVAWIIDSQPEAKYDFGKPLIVVREIEAKATYSNKKLDLLSLAKQLTKLGKVVYLSRYQRRKVEGIIVPQFVDSVSLVSQADLFVGVGGTMTREAALQGTPSIVIQAFSDQYVNDFLIRKGFPIFKAKIINAFRLAKRLVGSRYDVKHLLGDLENPVNTISDVIKEIPEK
jgi:predicted glycosyltransferase